MSDDIIKINVDEYGSSSPIQEFTLLQLVPENDPILKEIMPEFDFDNPPIDPNKLASELVENCKGRTGFGLSANQIGYRYRLFVMGAEDEYVAFFNPKILSYSSDLSMITEGCLSFPMLALKIERPKTVEVQYQDFTGEVRTGFFSGLSAHIFQHELDHLNGMCYTERSKPMALKMGMKKRQKFNKMVERYNKATKKIESINNKSN